MTCHVYCASSLRVFFFNDTATTEIYTLSLHDALPISITDELTEFALADDARAWWIPSNRPRLDRSEMLYSSSPVRRDPRSEEHTSELQSPCNLVCRLLLEKKNYSVRVQNDCIIDAIVS